MYNIHLKQEENGRKGGRGSNIFLMLPWSSLRFDPEGWYGEGGGFRMGNTCIPVADSF